VNSVAPEQINPVNAKVSWCFVTDLVHPAPTWFLIAKELTAAVPKLADLAVQFANLEMTNRWPHNSRRSLPRHNQSYWRKYSHFKRFGGAG